MTIAKTVMKEHIYKCIRFKTYQLVSLGWSVINTCEENAKRSYCVMESK